MPFGAVVSQHSDRDLVKEKHARTQRYKAQPTQAQAEENTPIAIVVPQSTYQSEYTFNGKIGTILSRRAYQSTNDASKSARSNGGCI